MKIRDGWFEGRNAELKSTQAGDWVRIEGEEVVEFCVKDGSIISPKQSVIDYDERDLLHVYDLLRKREQA
jgi:hypothetical protein